MRRCVDAVRGRMLLRRRARRIAAWDGSSRGAEGRERVYVDLQYVDQVLRLLCHLRAHVFFCTRAAEITPLGRVPTTKMAPLSWLLVAQAFALSDALTVPSSVGWTRRSAIGGLVATGFVRAAVAEDEDAPAELSPPLPPPPPARMLRIEDRLPLVLRNPL